jgi:PTH2 family peptidyl-tRNA hydrolase
MTGYKQAILIRKDLKLSIGKACSQSAHASLSAALLVQKKNPELFDRWVNSGQKKVVLKVENEKQLWEFKKKASALKLQTAMIKDAGLTQLPPGTTTALAIGPDEDEKIDKLVGELPLL